MKVAILGTGDVGKSLGAGFKKHGHDVRFGHRDPKESYADAAKFGEIAVLATPWSGTESAIKLTDPKNLAGKVVIDVTNPLKFEESQAPQLALGFDDSGGEQVQRWLPQSKVVKCFNIVGNSLMVDPKIEGGPPDMFIAGNDAGAKQTVTKICKEFGWPVVDIGGIEGARLLEPLAMLWVIVGFKLNRWEQAWKLLHK
ncbi:MAG TPA: NAD(P)-binding domain-containing protein [Gemmatimonadales bacterium]|jgi:predicted dinucleotide-binding enzyme|nr:NAD(P)-binding domain-containing protein [Gemmatimonadales bacterium]